jgi:hypothetical protein
MPSQALPELSRNRTLLRCRLTDAIDPLLKSGGQNCCPTSALPTLVQLLTGSRKQASFHPCQAE